MSGYLESIVVLLAINTVMAYAAYLPIAAGQLNLGIAGFVAIGAYTGAFLSNSLGLHPLAASAIAGLVCTAAGVVLAFPVLRSKGIYLALATFAFGQVVQGLILNLDVVGGASGYVVQKHMPAVEIIGVAVIVIAAVAVVFRTRFALAIAAVSEDELMAGQMGQFTRLVQTLAFSMGAGIAGIAGALLAHHYNYVEAQQFNVFMSIFVVLYVLLGGARTLYGPAAGAAVFTVLPELLRSSAQWRYVAFAVVILAVMMFRPQGLVTSGFAALARRLRTPGRAAS